MCLSSVSLPLTTFSGPISSPVLTVQIRFRFNLPCPHNWDHARRDAPAKKGLSVLSRHHRHRRLVPPTHLELVIDVGRTLASWILTVVVLCGHFQHTRDNGLLRTPLIDVPWLFPSSSLMRTLMISSLHVQCTWLHSDSRLFVELSSQGVHFSRFLLALVSACVHLRPQRVGPSTHFTVPGSTESTTVAERHARH